MENDNGNSGTSRNDWNVEYFEQMTKLSSIRITKCSISATHNKCNDNLTQVSYVSHHFSKFTWPHCKRSL